MKPLIDILSIFVIGFIDRKRLLKSIYGVLQNLLKLYSGTVLIFQTLKNCIPVEHYVPTIRLTIPTYIAATASLTFRKQISG